MGEGGREGGSEDGWRVGGGVREGWVGREGDKDALKR